ncbi:MAG: response regulator transcription factor [bacterium]|nr:response regulator transcription factor [bacterium]
MRFLVVDADLIAASWTAEALTAGGHHAFTAADAREAHALLALADLDGMVIAMPMPEDSGWQLLQALRADSRTRGLPVLVVSEGKDRVRGLLKGADDSLPKLVEEDEVVARAERMVELRAAPPGGLLGDLSEDSLHQLLSSLERERGTGVLRLIGERRDGWVELERGLPVSARYGLLSGESALLALLDTHHGQVTFERRREGEGIEALEIGPLSGLLARLEQLEDRLRRFEVHLPETRANLRIKGDLDPELATPHDTPYDEVYQRISALPGVTIEELLSHEIAPEIHVRLALAVLIKTEVVEEIRD